MVEEDSSSMFGKTGTFGKWFSYMMPIIVITLIVGGLLRGDFRLRFPTSDSLNSFMYLFLFITFGVSALTQMFKKRQPEMAKAFSSMQVFFMILAVASIFVEGAHFTNIIWIFFIGGLALYFFDLYIIRGIGKTLFGGEKPVTTLGELKGRWSKWTKSSDYKGAMKQLEFAVKEIKTTLENLKEALTVKINLPETIGERRTERIKCQDVNVRIIQDGKEEAPPVPTKLTKTYGKEIRTCVFPRPYNTVERALSAMGDFAETATDRKVEPRAFGGWIKKVVPQLAEYASDLFNDACVLKWERYNVMTASANFIEYGTHQQGRIIKRYSPEKREEAMREIVHVLNALHKICVNLQAHAKILGMSGDKIGKVVHMSKVWDIKTRGNTTRDYVQGRKPIPMDPADGIIKTDTKLDKGIKDVAIRIQEYITALRKYHNIVKHTKKAAIYWPTSLDTGTWPDSKYSIVHYKELEGTRADELTVIRNA